MNLTTIQKDDILEVKIEKLLYEGKGLARVNDFPIFVENVCPQDIVKIQIAKVNKTYAIANLIEIVMPSKYRIEPMCSLHNICGSCNWLFIDYKENRVVCQRKLFRKTIFSM